MSKSPNNDRSETAVSPPPTEETALTGTPQTMLATLLARAKDAQSAQPILNDAWSIRIMQGIRDDVDFAGLHVDATQMTAMLLRGKTLDRWTRDFLRRHPESTVLQLGCGLDTRCLRLRRGRRVRWVDVDLPAVVAYRSRVMQHTVHVPVEEDEDEGDYTLLAASVTDDAWLDQVPADRPTLVLMEGLLEYLDPADVQRLIRRLVDRFSPRGGELIFDAVGSVTAWLGNYLVRGPVRAAGATVRWALDDPVRVEGWSSLIRLREVQRLQEHEEFGRLPWGGWGVVWLASWIPGVRDRLAFNLRYAF